MPAASPAEPPPAPAGRRARRSIPRRQQPSPLDGDNANDINTHPLKAPSLILPKDHRGIVTSLTAAEGPPEPIERGRRSTQDEGATRAGDRANEALSGYPAGTRAEVLSASADAASTLRACLRSAGRRLDGDEQRQLRRLRRIDSVQSRRRKHAEYLDTAWGSRAAWCGGPGANEALGSNVLSDLVTITKLAVEHHVPLEDLWAEGKLLARAAGPGRAEGRAAGLTSRRLEAAKKEFKQSLAGSGGRGLGASAPVLASPGELNVVEDRDAESQVGGAKDQSIDAHPRGVEEDDAQHTGGLDYHGGFDGSFDDDNGGPSHIVPAAPKGNRDDQDMRQRFSTSPSLETGRQAENRSYYSTIDDATEEETLQLGDCSSNRQWDNAASFNLPELPDDDPFGWEEDTGEPSGTKTPPAGTQDRPFPYISITDTDDDAAEAANATPSRTSFAKRHALDRALPQLRDPHANLTDDSVECITVAILKSLERSDGFARGHPRPKVSHPLWLELDREGKHSLPSRLPRAVEPDVSFLIPLHHRRPYQHWTLARVIYSRAAVRIEHFDSLFRQDLADTVQERMSAWLKTIDATADKPVSFTSMSCPAQSDGSSCGCYMLANFLRLLRGEGLPRACSAVDVRNELLGILMQAGDEGEEGAAENAPTRRDVVDASPSSIGRDRTRGYDEGKQTALRGRDAEDGHHPVQMQRSRESESLVESIAISRNDPLSSKPTAWQDNEVGSAVVPATCGQPEEHVPSVESTHPNKHSIPSRLKPLLPTDTTSSIPASSERSPPPPSPPQLQVDPHQSQLPPEKPAQGSGAIDADDKVPHKRNRHPSEAHVACRVEPKRQRLDGAETSRASDEEEQASPQERRDRKGKGKGKGKEGEEGSAREKASKTADQHQPQAQPQQDNLQLLKDTLASILDSDSGAALDESLARAQATSSAADAAALAMKQRVAHSRAVYAEIADLAAVSAESETRQASQVERLLSHLRLRLQLCAGTTTRESGAQPAPTAAHGQTLPVSLPLPLPLQQDAAGHTHESAHAHAHAHAHSADANDANEDDEPFQSEVVGPTVAAAAAGLARYDALRKGSARDLLARAEGRLRGVEARCADAEREAVLRGDDAARLGRWVGVWRRMEELEDELGDMEMDV